MNPWIKLKPEQLKKLFETRLAGGEVAFSVVVLAAYAMLFSTQTAILSPSYLTLMLLLGLVYTTVGLLGTRLMELVSSLKLTLAFFVLMISLGGVINYLGNMSPWLILLPLCSMAVECLPKYWGYAASFIIWIAMLIPVLGSQPVEMIITVGAEIFAAIVFVIAFTQSMLDERRVRKELASANQKLREYAAKVEDLATVQERNRLAREIHDGLGHYLTAINIQIKAAQSVVKANPDLALESMNNAQILTQEALADVRRSISSLRNDPSSNRPIVEILAQLLKEVQAAGVEGSMNVVGEPRPLLPQVEFTLYRVTQEALTNVQKHAHASRVELKLEYRVNKVCLDIVDNGIGAENVEGGFGLTGLQERVQLLNGSLDLKTAPGQGLLLQVEIPA